MTHEERILLARIKAVRGLRIKTEAGPGRVWELYEASNRIGVEVEGVKSGPLFFALDEVLRFNVFGRDNSELLWLREY